MRHSLTTIRLTCKVYLWPIAPHVKGVFGRGISLAAARDADRTFKEGVCRPEQKIVDKKFGKVVKEKDRHVYIQVERVDPNR